eukprot:764658-Hanusia_phi.AAC.14
MEKEQERKLGRGIARWGYSFGAMTMAGRLLVVAMLAAAAAKQVRDERRTDEKEETHEEEENQLDVLD